MQLEALKNLRIWEHTVQKPGFFPAELFVLNFTIHISLHKIPYNSFLNN
jgi:hypothetical protein